MIILFRHAKPIMDYGSCNHGHSIDRLNDYNSTINLKFDDLDAKKPKNKGIDASLYLDVVGRSLNKNLNKWNFLNYTDLF